MMAMLKEPLRGSRDSKNEDEIDKSIAALGARGRTPVGLPRRWRLVDKSIAALGVCDYGVAIQSWVR